MSMELKPEILVKKGFNSKMFVIHESKLRFMSTSTALETVDQLHSRMHK